MIKWENKLFEIEESESDDEEEEYEEETHEFQSEKGLNKSVNLTIGARKMALPEGSISRSHSLYEEIYIPPLVNNNKQFLDNFPRVSVDTLDAVVSLRKLRFFIFRLAKKFLKD